jgi:hypothetical protein
VQLFAASFLKHPGDTLRAGVALAVASNRRSRQLASFDQIRSQNIADLAGAAQLVVAGCLRAVRDQKVLHDLLSSHAGAKAISSAIEGECRVILALPGEKRACA